MTETIERDLWWEAREYTRQLGALYGNPAQQIKVLWSTLSLPGQATKRVPMQIVGAGRAICFDLNVYRKSVDVKMAADLGVQVFDLRLFCPGRWFYGDWQYYQDSSFEPYLNILVTIPGITIGAYGVYNPWLDEEASYQSPLDPNVELMKLYTKNFINYLQYVTWDVEVGTCTKSTNTNNGITATNLVKGLSRTMSQTLKQLPGIKQPDGQTYPRIPEMYSAEWFLRGYGEAVKVWLEQTLADPANMPFLQWLAWYYDQPTETWGKPGEYFDHLPTPNGVQEDAYLHDRSEPLACKWQACSTLLGPWCKDGKGIDASITYGLGAQYSKYRELHNIPVTTTPPPDKPPVTPPADGELADRLTAAETRIAALEAKVSAVKAALG